MDEVTEGGSDFSCSSIVTSQVVISCGLEIEGFSCNELGFSKGIKGLFEVFFVQIDHGCQIKVFAELFRGSFELEMVHTVNIFLDTDDLLHDVDAFVVLSLG